MNGKNLLNEALATFKQRQREYGNPTQLFDELAERWSLVVGHKITASQVIQCMIELKLARLKHNPKHEDSMVDIAGYAACLAEVEQ